MAIFDGQRIAVINARQIVVALKRNDEYALNIKCSRIVNYSALVTQRFDGFILRKWQT